MKRSPLIRRTPLRRTPIRRSSTSKADFHPSVRHEIARRSKGRCEAGTPDCVGRATMIHHIRRRSQGGKGTVANGLHVCAPCHTFIHDHPWLSAEAGWLARGVDPLIQDDAG